jgi:uncharacterized protein (UPF0332 family)
VSKYESYKQTLIQYRLEQAREGLDEAQTLYEQEKSPRSIINRAYYAMFYAALALLITIDEGTSKHRGVIALFDREFINRNIFPKEMSKALHHAFEMRQVGDYREMTKLSREQAQEVLNSAFAFVKSVEEKLSK